MTKTLLALGAIVLFAALPAAAAQPQAIRIETFLYASPTGPNTFAITGCFASTGAIVDDGGAPLRNGAGDIVGCGSPAGISGTAHFDGLGHLKSGRPNVLQAQHTLYGRYGSIEISFEGKYEAIQ